MSELSFAKTVLLGATGATGIAAVERLRERIPAIRVVSRSRENLERRFPDPEIERFASDVLDPTAAFRAIQGCDLVFDCIGLPGDLMDRHPKVAENVAEAVKKTGARCLQVSSYWPYLPIEKLPLDESHPRRDGPPWVRYRRAAEDILQESGAAILNLPDFYGPHVGASILQNALRDAVRGKAMSWIGGEDVPREHAYVPDTMTIAVTLAHREEAYGERWIVSGAGPLTGGGLARIVSDHFEREVELRAAGLWTLRAVSLFHSELRRLLPMVPHYLKPISYDASKLESLIGKLPVTPYERGVKETLEALRE